MCTTARCASGLGWRARLPEPASAPRVRSRPRPGDVRPLQGHSSPDHGAAGSAITSGPATLSHLRHGTFARPSPAAAQSFLKVYDTLRDELINDECLTSAADSAQSKDAQSWFKEVGVAINCSACAPASWPAAMPNPARHAAPCIRQKSSSCTCARHGPQVNDYNVPGGKLNRGMAVYDVLVSIKGADVSDPCVEPARGVPSTANWQAAGRLRTPGRSEARLERCRAVHRGIPTECIGVPSQQELSEDHIFKANALGWCIEWVRPRRSERHAARAREPTCGRPPLRRPPPQPFRTSSLHPHMLCCRFMWLAAPSLLPCGGRHHGRLHHSPRPAVLVSQARGDRPHNTLHYAKHIHSHLSCGLDARHNIKHGTQRRDMVQSSSSGDDKGTRRLQGSDPWRCTRVLDQALLMCLMCRWA
jgi:hypothetical protein